jgi:hypothetical protein
MKTLIQSGKGARDDGRESWLLGLAKDWIALRYSAGPLVPHQFRGALQGSGVIPECPEAIVAISTKEAASLFCSRASVKHKAPGNSYAGRGISTDSADSVLIGEHSAVGLNVDSALGLDRHSSDPLDGVFGPARLAVKGSPAFIRGSFNELGDRLNVLALRADSLSAAYLRSLAARGEMPGNQSGRNRFLTKAANLCFGFFVHKISVSAFLAVKVFFCGSFFENRRLERAACISL